MILHSPPFSVSLLQFKCLFLFLSHNHNRNIYHSHIQTYSMWKWIWDGGHIRNPKNIFNIIFIFTCITKVLFFSKRWCSYCHIGAGNIKLKNYSDQMKRLLNCLREKNGIKFWYKNGIYHFIFIWGLGFNAISPQP